LNEAPLENFKLHETVADDSRWVAAKEDDSILTAAVTEDNDSTVAEAVVEDDDFKLTEADVEENEFKLAKAVAEDNAPRQDEAHVADALDPKLIGRSPDSFTPLSSSRITGMSKTRM